MSRLESSNSYGLTGAGTQYTGEIDGANVMIEACLFACLQAPMRLEHYTTKKSRQSEAEEHENTEAIWKLYT